MSPSSAPQYNLTVQPPDENTRIEILDGNLRSIPLDHNLGEVSVRVSTGVYAVRFYQGHQFTEKLAALTPDSPAVVVVSLDPQQQPKFATAAPVRGTSTTREWQRGPALELSLSPARRAPDGQTGGSRVLLFLRNPFEPAGALMVGVTLCTLDDRVIFDLENEGQHNEAQGWVGAHLNLDAGAYKLRRVADGKVVDQVVFTQRDWQTQVFLLATGGSGSHAEVLRTSILMAASTVGFNFERPDLRWTESALRALESRANVPGETRQEMLWAKFENPMLGIYAALLQLRRPVIDGALMREVFSNLHALVGPLPDVLAIGWAIALRDAASRSDRTFMGKLRETTSIRMPPMLRESWEYLLKANADENELVVPGSLADRIGGQLVSGSPWLVWTRELTLSAVGAQAAHIPNAQEIAAASAESRGLFGFLSELAGKFFNAFRDTALKSVLSTLSNRLRSDISARYWLQTNRFTDLERATAYWIRPAINPQLAGVIEEAPELEKRFESTGRTRATDVPAMLTELDIAATTALRTAWSVFTKLYVRPVVPDESWLAQFVEQESRTQPLFEGTLKRLRSRTSRIHCPPISRSLNLLEFAYLYYRGSPAAADADRDTIARLAETLDEAGFAFLDEQKKVTRTSIMSEHASMRQEVVELIQRSRSWQVKQLLPSWEDEVFPTARRYERGRLFPLLASERSDTKPTDSASSSDSTPGSPVPA
ncbi:MAG: hypothetical protein ABJA98_08905 [Acidobacteriota bacterium]